MGFGWPGDLLRSPLSRDFPHLRPGRGQNDISTGGMAASPNGPLANASARQGHRKPMLSGCDSAGDSFFGRSAIIDPWGETVIEGGEEEGLFSAVIDLDLVDDVRAKIPVFEDRRDDIYG